MKAKRIGWIDALRALGATAVVMIHVISGWLDDPIGGGSYGSLIRGILDGVIVQGLTRWAVPVFVMISGYLLLDPEKEMSLEKVKRYILRMLAVLGTFGLAYCLIETFISRGVKEPLMSVGISVFNLVEGESWGHMWYVYMLAGLYILTPMLRAFVRSADEQTFRFTLAALFLCTAVVPTANKLFGTKVTRLIPISSECLFYYIAGYAIKRFGIPARRARVLAGVGLAFFVGTMILALNGLKGLTADMGDGNNAGVMLYSVGLFALAKESAALEALSQTRLFRSIARHSFGIYLTHPIFMNLLNKGLHVFPNMLPIGIGELAFFAVAMLGSWLASAILCRLEFFRRILL